jgi:hypothetical protein
LKQPGAIIQVRFRVRTNRTHQSRLSSNRTADAASVLHPLCSPFVDLRSIPNFIPAAAHTTTSKMQSSPFTSSSFTHSSLLDPCHLSINSASRREMINLCFRDKIHGLTGWDRRISTMAKSGWNPQCISLKVQLHGEPQNNI